MNVRLSDANLAIVNRLVLFWKRIVASTEETVEFIKPARIGMKLRLDTHVPFANSSREIPRVLENCADQCFTDGNPFLVIFFDALARVW